MTPANRMQGRMLRVFVMFIIFASDDVAKKNLGSCSPGVIKKTFTPGCVPG
jgi:hypothetical protein